MDMHPVWGPVALGLVTLGVLWFVVLGIAFGRLTDVGVYSVGIMLLGTGLAGFWASRNMAAHDDSG